jgi:hypothetical protein
MPNSQQTEHWIPFDHLIAGQGLKIFGLQYKRLYPNSDRWRLSAGQHQQMQHFDWIYYALSDLKHIDQHRNALHLLRLVESDFRHRSSLYPEDLGSGKDKIRYARWGGFVRGLFRCYFGWAPADPYEIRSSLAEVRELAEFLVDIYVVAPAAKTVVRISPFVADLGEEEPFDFGLDWDEESLED